MCIFSCILFLYLSKYFLFAYLFSYFGAPNVYGGYINSYFKTEVSK